METNKNICPCCGQKITYEISLDKGTADIMRAMAVAIKVKGENLIHPRNEMEGSKSASYEEMIQNGKITSNMTGNLSRARFHGLICKIKGMSGYYGLTTKGLSFLTGQKIPRTVIRSKVDKKIVGNTPNDLVSIHELLGSSIYWSGIDYTIREHKVV